MSLVLESAEYVVKHSQYVKVNLDRIKAVSSRLARRPLSIPEWDTTYHFFDGTEKTLSYFLVLDTLNFCFWPAPGKQRWTIAYKGERLSGYHALATALKRAFLSGVPLDDCHYLAQVKRHDLETVLHGQGHLQLMDRRLEALQELGVYLRDQWGGKVSHLVAAAKGSAIELVHLVARGLNSFQDAAVYKRKIVYFYKRAQILAADIYGAFQGQGRGTFQDMDQLTAFADYKLPQVLRHLGILQYEPELAQRIDHMVLIPQGSPEEVEIRAHTIWAVELLQRELNRMGMDIRPFEIDWLLWNMGQREGFRKKPYHRTITIFY